METLRAGVLQALQENKTTEEIIASDLMSEYSDWGSYEDWRSLNIEGMARWLQETGQVTKTE